jgi:hypothetical protein
VFRLHFRSLKGDLPTSMHAHCVRFGADGTLRGPDNCVIAHYLEGGWKLGGRIHRELECEGPVRLRLVRSGQQAPDYLGPFKHLHTTAGVLYADDACLHILMPGQRKQGEGMCQQLTLVSEGESNAST